MTAPDTFGSEENFDPTSHSVLNIFELLDERSVDRFQQLVLFCFIGNYMNMHLYIDLRDKEVLELVG